jgi:hypothetical protein
MIVVITDGEPHCKEDVRAQIAFAYSEGVMTGGIGVGGYADPDYHMHHVSVADASALPNALGVLVRNMMKGRR